MHLKQTCRTSAIVDARNRRHAIVAYWEEEEEKKRLKSFADCLTTVSWIIMSQLIAAISERYDVNRFESLLRKRCSSRNFDDDMITHEGIAEGELRRAGS